MHLKFKKCVTFKYFRTVSIDCATVQTKIVQQINDWDNEDCGTKPGDTEPHGQKCLYKVHFKDFFKKYTKILKNLKTFSYC